MTLLPSTEYSDPICAVNKASDFKVVLCKLLQYESDYVL